MSVKDEVALRRRIEHSPLLHALGDGFAAGEWNSEELTQLLTRQLKRFRVSNAVIALLTARRWRRGAELNHNREQALSNAMWHYDLPASFFENVLDPSLTYSSALFVSGNEELEAAQQQKRSRVLDFLAIRSGTRILDIGCGWGALAYEAAGRGATVLGVSASAAQIEHASMHHSHPSITFIHSDYRDVSGCYDAVVCIEMVEALGSAGLREFMTVVPSALNPGGRLVLQFIHTSADRRFAGRKSHETWIRKRIFPGGQIPTFDAVVKSAKSKGLSVQHCLDLSSSYARTLRVWAVNLETNINSVLRQGYSEAFIRQWQFYLALSEAGFLSGDLRCAQIVLGKS